MMAAIKKSTLPTMPAVIARGPFRFALVSSVVVVVVVTMKRSEARREKERDKGEETKPTIKLGLNTGFG